MLDRRDSHSAERIASLIARCLSDDATGAVHDIDRDGLWEYVATQACKAKLGGLLLHALRRQRQDVPLSAVMQLEAYHQHQVAAHAYQLSRTAPVLARLRAESVPFLLLKGAALNAVAYDHPGMRAMLDIDVLVRPGDVQRADEVLSSCGCTRGADLVREDFFPRYYYEREYYTPHRPPVKIDLHVRALRPLRYARTMPADALWDQPQRVMYGPVPVLIPNAENMLIHLAAHAACHGLGQIKWLYDIKLWLDGFGERMNTAALADRCRAWGLSLPVQRALEKVAVVFGQPGPALLAALRSVSRPASLVDRLTLAHAPRDVDHPATALLVNMLCTPGVRFRLGYVRSVLLPDRAHLRQVYSRQHPGWPLVACLVRFLRRLPHLTLKPSDLNARLPVR